MGTEVGGTLANFSTYGPTLDERLKPNVSAPGMSVESSLSSFRDIGYSVTNTMEFDGTEYEFAKLSGTSMSSPAVAGVVALMLEANPELTAADIRSILESTAREDEDTGDLPTEGDHVWGHGKVTASQAVLAALNWDSSLGMPDFLAKRPQVFPNPVRERLWFTGLSGGKSTWEIFDLRGQLCQSGQAFDLSSIDVSTLQPGLHVIHVQSGHLAKSFKFLKHP